MTEQPTALRLADLLEKAPAHTLEDGTITLYLGGTVVADKAAAELRRLYMVDKLYQAALAGRNVMHLELHKANAERGTLQAQRDALLEAIKPMIDLAEFWINHGQKRHMCEQEFKVWLAIGHESDAMRNARATIKAVEEGK